MRWCLCNICRPWLGISTTHFTKGHLTGYQHENRQGFELSQRTSMCEGPASIANVNPRNCSTRRDMQPCSTEYLSIYYVVRHPKDPCQRPTKSKIDEHPLQKSGTCAESVPRWLNHAWVLCTRSLNLNLHCYCIPRYYTYMSCHPWILSCLSTPHR